VLPNLAHVVESVEGEVLFQLSVDLEDNICDIECLASSLQPKNLIPLDLLLERVVEVGGCAAVYVSRGSGRHGAVEECDLGFTARLIEAGRACGVEVRDHYIVERGGFFSLRGATGLWERD
jgi:hypothetical protein